MTITKYYLRILRYLYRQKSTSYFNLSKKFKGPELQETLELLFATTTLFKSVDLLINMENLSQFLTIPF